MLEIRWRNGGLRVPDWCIVDIKTGTNTSVIKGGHTTTVVWDNLRFGGINKNYFTVWRNR